MLPTKEEALKLIRDGLLFNPGPWGKHCLTAAHCAEKIASACGDMDVENLNYSRQCRESSLKPHSFYILTEYCISLIKSMKKEQPFVVKLR